MGKIKATVILGQQACNVYDETGSIDKVEEYIRKDCGDIRHLDFNTEEEKTAYIMGLNDGNGWEEFWFLEDK